ncbi:MAG: hypothetical protein F6K47_03565 [Symploca sp. SIO2E6]|nr:hypothetical protein [Symploca sp. SIO2E6]
MSSNSTTITLQIPDFIYQRLVNTAQATERSIEAVMLHALQIGSPPNWSDVPEEFQTDLAVLGRLEDQALWQIAQSHKTPEEMERHYWLLAQNQERSLTDAEQIELQQLKISADRFMLRKAHAAALLKWRGYKVTQRIV